MRSFLPLTVYCISLLALQRLQAAPAQERPRNRLDLLYKLDGKSGDISDSPGSQTNSTVSPPTPSQSAKWPLGLLRHPPATGARPTSPGLAWARPDEAARMERRTARARRYAHTGSRGGHHYPHHAQLMRVGCVLGTCQVQNLSHRLYQLIGQSGREDSSPINPKSPHSYG
ncbi:unnamed protein product [Ophioblennius macclurei]